MTTIKVKQIKYTIEIPSAKPMSKHMIEQIVKYEDKFATKILEQGLKLKPRKEHYAKCEMRVSKEDWSQSVLYYDGKLVGLFKRTHNGMHYGVTFKKDQNFD